MSDSEYEEETTYVIFDLGHTTTSELMEEVSDKAGGCRIIGLEEGRPYLQIGELTLEGTVDETIGTHLLFEMEDKESGKPSIKPNELKEGGKKTLKYQCSTENIITLETVSLVPKTVVPPRVSKEAFNDDSIIDAIFS